MLLFCRFGLVFHQTGFCKLNFVIIKSGQGAAQEPAGGISHGNWDDLIADVGHGKEIDLPEYHKGRNHNKIEKKKVKAFQEKPCIYLEYRLQSQIKNLIVVERIPAL